MGWASGSRLGEELWKEIKGYIPEDKHKKVAKKVYDMFCDEDADAWDPNEVIVKDAGLVDEKGNWIDGDV